jgi:hypothetical protein
MYMGTFFYLVTLIMMNFLAIRTGVFLRKRIYDTCSSYSMRKENGMENKIAITSSIISNFNGLF